METKLFVRIGDQVVNALNVVSFDIDGTDIVRIFCIWVCDTAGAQAPDSFRGFDRGPPG